MSIEKVKDPNTGKSVPMSEVSALRAGLDEKVKMRQSRTDHSKYLFAL